uniref:Ubiquitin-protein ligase E3A n=1 Tax=Culex pipiens TaxID=7175 RepID=A0A8D8AW99_CULPI
MNKDKPNKTDGDSRIDEESSSSSAATTTKSCTPSSSSSSSRSKGTSQKPAPTAPLAGTSASTSCEPPAATQSEEMKRASAKKLIERYFYQLVDGCGNPKCANTFCASSGKVEKLTPNAAAARAIQLFTQDAQLCDTHPSKMPKTMAATAPAVAATTTTVAASSSSGRGGSSSGNVSAGSSSGSSFGLDDSTVSTEPGTAWELLGNSSVDMEEINDSSNLEMDSMDEEEIPSLIKNQLHHYEGGGGEPSTNSACPYSLRSSTSTSQVSPSSLFAGSSKGSAKKKSSLLIGSGAGGSSKETNKKQRDSSPVDYLDEAKLRELMAA